MYLCDNTQDNVSSKDEICTAKVRNSLTLLTLLPKALCPKPTTRKTIYNGNDNKYGITLTALHKRNCTQLFI